jgi:hypothetical protein
MIRFAHFIIALAVVAGCHAKQSNTRQQVPLSPAAKAIENLGYHVKESSMVAPSPWEKSTLRLQSKRLFSFRANQPQPGSRDYFCRFDLFEETYDSAEDAQHRLANLHLPSPDASAEVNEYGRVMRSGFRIGTVVYYLQADAIMFWDEVQRVAKELANSTSGAEVNERNQ